MSEARAHSPLVVDVAVEPRELNLAETVRLEVRVSVDGAWVVREDQAGALAQGATLGDFLVERAATGRPTLAEDGRLVTVHELTLTPLATGELRIPPLAVRAAPLDEAAEAAPIATQTPAIDVAVVSLLENASETFSPAEIRAPLEPPAPGGLSPWLTGGAAAALVVALAGAALVAARRRRGAPASPIAPLRRRAGTLPTIEEPRDRARAAAAVARDALSLIIGERARAASLPELAPLLDTVPELAPPDRRAILDLLDRAERAAYAPAPPADGAFDPVPAIAAAERVRRARGAAP